MSLRTTRLIFVCVVMLLLIAGTERALADREVRDEDYSLVTSDQKFIFVMFIPDEEIDFSIKALNDTSHLPPDLQKLYPSPNYTSRQDFIERNGIGIDKALRVQYPASGLYRNDGSNTPIWTVDWYAQWVFVHPDGEHLVRMGRWPRYKGDSQGNLIYDELAIAFYNNGNETISYTVQDLVVSPESLPRTVSHYEWRKQISLDEPKGILTVETWTGEKYQFDIIRMSSANNAGAISCQPGDLPICDQPTKNPFVLLLVGVFVLLLAVVALRIRQHPLYHAS